MSSASAFTSSGKNNLKSNSAAILAISPDISVGSWPSFNSAFLCPITLSIFSKMVLPFKSLTYSRCTKSPSTKLYSVSWTSILYGNSSSPYTFIVRFPSWLIISPTDFPKDLFITFTILPSFFFLSVYVTKTVS